MTDENNGALLARHLPGHDVRSVRALGEGLDNAAYEVNGELILRKSKEADPALRAEATRREAALLAAVAGISTLPVPEPIFADAEAGVLAYRKLPGVPLVDHPLAEPARLAPGLGEFLSNLHQTSPEEVEHLVERDAYPLTAWLEDAERDYLEISGHLSAAARRQVEDFLGRTPPAEPRAMAFCHGDLGTEHVLMDTGDGVITGIIDWTDAAIADPACDLAPIYRDLGPEVFERTLDHYGTGLDEADRSRSAFYARCKLLEDVAYGLNTPGARRYAEVGLANLLRTFYSDTSGGSGRRPACQPFPPERLPGGSKPPDAVGQASVFSLRRPWWSVERMPPIGHGLPRPSPTLSEEGPRRRRRSRQASSGRAPVAPAPSPASRRARRRGPAFLRTARDG